MHAAAGCGMAVNTCGSICAVVDSLKNSLIICAIDGDGRPLDAPPAVTVPGLLSNPQRICFVHRNGRDTILVVDAGNERIVEVATDGTFLRTVKTMGYETYLRAVAYSPQTDLIAISKGPDDAIVIIDYESGVVTRTIGQRGCCTSIAFSADSTRIFVAYLVGVAMSVTHLNEVDECVVFAGFDATIDVLGSHDGGAVVASFSEETPRFTEVAYVSDAGSTRRVVVLPDRIVALAYVGINVVCKSYSGRMYVLEDEWMTSSRGTWVTVCSFSE